MPSPPALRKAQSNATGLAKHVNSLTTYFTVLSALFLLSFVGGNELANRWNMDSNVTIRVLCITFCTFFGSFKTCRQFFDKRTNEIDESIVLITSGRLVMQLVLDVSVID